MALEIVESSPFPDEVTGIFRALVALRAPAELVDPVLVAGWSLGVKRATLFQRRPFPLDADYAFSLLCWWPLKPEGNPEAVEELRGRSAEAAIAIAQGDAGPLDRLIPDAALLLPHETLYALQARGFVGHLEGETAP